MRARISLGVFVIAAIASIFLIGCKRTFEERGMTPLPGSAVSTPHFQKAREIGVSALRKDLQRLVTSPAGQTHEIPAASWPASVRRMEPQAVLRHMDGVLLVYSRSTRVEEGLLVMPDAGTDPGAGGSGVSYSSLGDGLYWCREKTRVSRAKAQQRDE